MVESVDVANQVSVARVTVELDAHHVVEVLPDELVQDEEEEEEVSHWLCGLENV